MDKPSSDSLVADAAVVGGGPAGLSAALWLARFMRTVVLIDSGDPRNWPTRGVNGFLGRPHIKPAELRGLGRDEVRRYPHAKLVDDTVMDVRRVNDDCFHLHLEHGPMVEARRVVLAYGLRDVWPDVKGLGNCYGETAHVCPDCDGYEARGRPVVVIGDGRRAAGMALKLTAWTRDVTICTNGEPADLDSEAEHKLKINDIRVVETRTAELRKHELELADGSVLPCEHVFFSLGQMPADDLGAQLGCKRDERGQIMTDEHRHTSVRNVWAAGDIVPGPQLAIGAAADGAVAALSIHQSLVPEERTLD